MGGRIFTSWQEFRRNLRPISLLAIGLVVVTSGAVAVVARWLLPGMGWAEAIALGAIVSPPDAVSATAIGKRLRIPRRVVTILEGESLVNDATALVVYRMAVGVAVGGSFAPGQGLVTFVFAASVRVAIGIAVSIAARWALCATHDSFTEIAITLLAPTSPGSWGNSCMRRPCWPGGRHTSGSISVPPCRRSPNSRPRGVGCARVCVERIHLHPHRVGTSCLEPGDPRRPRPGPHDRHRCQPRGHRCPSWLGAARRADSTLVERVAAGARSASCLAEYLLIAWTGMRGIVTLAAALALPVATADGTPLPSEAEIILISFTVILVTLVLQGLSLTPSSGSCILKRIEG